MAKAELTYLAEANVSNRSFFCCHCRRFNVRHDPFSCDEVVDPWRHPVVVFIESLEILERASGSVNTTINGYPEQATAIEKLLSGLTNKSDNI